MWEMLQNIVLFPKSLYARLTEKKLYLILGILMVGCIDIFLPISQVKSIFLNKPIGVFLFNLTVALLMVVILGAVDVLFMAKPLCDVFKFFKKAEPMPDDDSVLFIKVAKVYILSHFLIIPFNIIVDSLLMNVYTIKRYYVLYMTMILLIYFYEWIVYSWSAAIMFRGANAIYKFENEYKILIFIAILIWNILFSLAITYMEINWVIPLFKK